MYIEGKLVSCLFTHNSIFLAFGICHQSFAFEVYFVHFSINQIFNKTDYFLLKHLQPKSTLFNP